MKWIVSHQSALEFWRKSYVKAVAGTRTTMKPPVLPRGTKELKAVNFWGLMPPLHVLVGAGSARKVCRGLRCHVNSCEHPGGSFLRMASGMVVSSQELCFMQMAHELSLVELVALGYELCGSYRLGSAPDQGFRADLPLTSVSGLGSYAAKAVGMRGRVNAQRALRYIADGSASPMETILAMLLTLPYSLGGYGFPRPQLNYCVATPAGASAGKAAGDSKYYCDLYWPDAKVDVEYDSDAYHTGSDRIAKDAIRRNALIRAGVTVISVSRIQINSAPELRELAKLLSKLLGKRLQFDPREFAYRHAKLMTQLLPKGFC